MSKPLPYADFKWCNFDLNEILNYDASCQTGYILDVDLEYPKELHDKHNDYPLGPEPIKVKADLISSHSQTLYKNITHTIKEFVMNKLKINLEPKQ